MGWSNFVFRNRFQFVCCTVNIEFLAVVLRIVRNC